MSTSAPSRGSGRSILADARRVSQVRTERILTRSMPASWIAAISSVSVSFAATIASSHRVRDVVLDDAPDDAVRRGSRISAPSTMADTVMRRSSRSRPVDDDVLRHVDQRRVR